ncbi:MAG: 4-hydroxybenzoate octaprenyltransferase [Cellvibrionaceae bacterium]|nr:4-hydroxybenzoate octaprenyltransferase [Cellvibrionaceae bacterium]
MPSFSIARCKPYWVLMRFHRPIGILLLLWPTWWALWLAAEGLPNPSVLIIFTLGVIVMRAAGCVINDIADHKIDRQVLRTQQRPLASGELRLSQAWTLFAGLMLLAFTLVLLTNTLTIMLSLAALALACAYPFAKRYTHLPQLVLGAAFSMSIPMAFAAQQGALDAPVVLVYLTNVLWTVTYDTFYGMTDREYDKRIGVKSTAILFEGSERFATTGLQLLSLCGWLMIGQRYGLGETYWLSLVAVAALMYYQQCLISQAQPKYYFAAFMNNHWIGMSVFIGIALHFLLAP